MPTAITTSKKSRGTPSNHKRGGECHDYRDDNGPWPNVRGRTSVGPAPRRDREHRRDHHRVVRLSDLRHGDRPGLQQGLLPRLRCVDRHAAGVRRLLRRLRGAADRRRDLRALRRPHRPQGDPHRHLAAPDPGHRRRWRMGRLGAAGDGVDADQQEPRLHQLVAAIRRAGRTVSGQCRGAVLQLVLGRSIPELGLAHPVPHEHHHGGHRAVDPPRCPRDPGVPAPRRREEDRARPDHRSVQAAAARGHPVRDGTDGRAGPAYIFNAFVVSYGTLVVGASRNLLLSGLVAMTVLGFITLPIAGLLTDRIGRRKVFISGCVLVAVFTFVYFAMLDTKVPELIFIAMALSFIPIMIMYAAESSLIAESFTPRLRYRGASIGYQSASIIAGGPAPFIATWLFATYHSSFPIGIYACVCAAISICSALMLPDRTNKDIAHEVNYGNA